MVCVSRETYDRFGVATVVDSDRNVWLNENRLEEGLDQKGLSITKQKYISNHGKHRYELVDKPEKQLNRFFLLKRLSIKVIMGCRRPAAYKFRTRLEFKQYDVILTKKNQS